MKILYPIVGFLCLFIGGCFGLVGGLLLSQIHIQSPTTSLIDRPDFEQSVRGQYAETIIKNVGKPNYTRTKDGKPYKDGMFFITPTYELWFYEKRTRDPISGRPDLNAVVTMSQGACMDVKFNQ